MKRAIRHYDVNGTNEVVENAPAHPPAAHPPIQKDPFESELKFHFTRHATSCYNIEIRERTFPLNDGIPSLACSGIESTIALAENNQGTGRFMLPEQGVYVSNLIRTWMTAVLLYAYDKESITLRMSPHLRETGAVGNDAHPLTSSFPKFIAFLEQIKRLPRYGGLQKITLSIVQTIRRNTYWGNIEIDISKDTRNVTYDTESFCSIVDPLQVSSIKDGYKDVGDLNAFMKWISIYGFLHFTAAGLTPTEIHVVTHSGIMKEYVKATCKGLSYRGSPFNMSTYSLRGNHIDPIVRGKPLDVQNCWTFTTTYDDTKDKTEEMIYTRAHYLLHSIQTGYLNPGKGPTLKRDQEKERKQGPNSLCLQQVAPIPCKNGGSQTKRNRRSPRHRSRRR